MAWEQDDRMALSKLWDLIQDLLAEQKLTNARLDEIARLLSQRSK